jgi:hypothetical protein
MGKGVDVPSTLCSDDVVGTRHTVGVQRVPLCEMLGFKMAIIACPGDRCQHWEPLEELNGDETIQPVL